MSEGTVKVTVHRLCQRYGELLRAEVARTVGSDTETAEELRQVGSDHDWATFNSLDAVIGLGNAKVADTLRVEWPSGIVQFFCKVFPCPLV